MRKIYFILVLFFSVFMVKSYAQTDITADFTDPNFRAVVYETIGKADSLPIYDTDVAGITDLAVSGENISSVDGIEHFTALEWLDCFYTQISTLDVSNLTNLRVLACIGNNLTSLDVSNLTNLQELYCGINQLSTLDVANLTNLRRLNCSINQLSTLDVSNLTNLVSLICFENNISTLDVANLINLQRLECADNNISTLDVANLTNLQELYCGINQLSTLDVANLTNLVSLICSENNISTLDVSGLNQLTYLDCRLNYLTATPTGYNPAITTNYRFDPQKTPPTISVTGISLNKTTISMSINDTEQLTATIYPADATDKSVNWSSDNTSVATVSVSGLITGLGEGTATVTATTQDGGFTARCTVTVEKNQTIVVDEGKPAGSNGTGSIILSLEIPSNVPFSGTFKIELPAGMSIDTTATNLVETLRTSMTLIITQQSAGSWLFTITSTPLRSSMALSYQKIADIVYRIDESVSDGNYQAFIYDLNLNFDDGIRITEPEIPVSLRVDHSYTGIPQVSAEIKAYISDNILYVNSPVGETVNLYSVSGSLLYSRWKPAGEVQIPLGSIQDKILIVRGSSGWVRKGVGK